MGLQLQKYSGYQQTDLPWLDEVPVHWELKRNKYLLTEKKEVVGNNASDYTLLSLTLKGIIVRDMENPKGKFPAEFNTYKVVYPDDLVFCLFDIEETPRTIGRAHQKGMITGAYTVMKCGQEVSARYLSYYYLSLDYDKRLKPLYTGLRKVIQHDTFMSLKSPLPPHDEQDCIANFLDQKTVEIEEAIAKKQRLIELLKEQKTVLINQAVTKGLNPDVPMRDSGAAWVGEVPEDWVVKRAKFLFYEIDERSQTGAEELLSVSHMTGVTPRSEKNIYMFMAEDYSGSKVCREGDLVFNIMWAWMGALGVSDRAGIVSPSYGVYRQRYKGAFNSWFLENLLHSGQYVAEYNRRSTGLHSSRLRLYPDMFFDMEIGFPAKLEQDRIEQAIKEKTADIDNAVSAVNAEIEALSEYRQVVIAEVVTGKIKL